MRKFENILLLAGGDSSRFWPIDDKNLVKFLGEPLILYQIRNLAKFACRLLVVVNSVNKDKIKAYNTTLDKNIPPVELIVQGKEMIGQAGAILSAKGKIKGEVLIVNASDIFDYNILFSLLQKIAGGCQNFVFLARKIKQYFPGGYLKFANGKIEKIIEKPRDTNVPSDIVKLVVDYFGDFDTLVAALEKIDSQADNGYEQALNLLLSSGKSDYVLYDGLWLPLKYPWHVLTMMKFFLHGLTENKIEKEITIGKNTIIKPPVYLENDVKIGDFVKIIGPTYIGSKTIVGDYTMIRESNIGSGCLIGSGCEVTRSYLEEGVSLHRNYIGDSVLSKGVLIGAGAVTANYRFDEKAVKTTLGKKRISTQCSKLGAVIGAGAKIGVNSTLLPGVLIGKNSFIGPGVVVSENIEDEIFVFKEKKKKNDRVS